MVDDSRLACQLIKHIQIVDVHVNNTAVAPVYRRPIFPIQDEGKTLETMRLRTCEMRERRTDGRTIGVVGLGGQRSSIMGFRRKKRAGGWGDENDEEFDHVWN